MKSFNTKYIEKRNYDNQKSLFGDFVPPKVGKRMIDTIKFTVKLKCFASDMDLDSETKNLLRIKKSFEESIDSKDLPYDYESIPILSEFKTE